MSFPITPTEGQIYNGYQYTNGMWNKSDGNELTLLADYPTRKYTGTITLSEPATNFRQLVVRGHYHSTNNHVRFEYLQTDIMSPGDLVYLWNVHGTVADGTGYFARWYYTNDTTFTYESEYNSWIRSIHGIGRK